MAGAAMSYATDPNSSVRINIEDYADLVKRIALHLIARMPASVQLDDLLQAGMVGLLEAAQKFDASRGASFETYAGIRIRGAIIDEMRRGDWVPRSVHKNSRRIAQASNNIEARLGREAQTQEIADELGVSVDEYHAMANDSVSGRLFSFEENNDEEDGAPRIHQIAEQDGQYEPMVTAQNEQFQLSLAGAIATLPEKEQLVLSLYYSEEMNLKEIGLILGVSESRVSQIHSQAASKLKKKLSSWS